MPISEERKRQLLGFAEKIKADPELQQRILGTQPTTPIADIQRRIGLQPEQITPAIGGKLVGAAITETAPPTPREAPEAIATRIGATKQAEQLANLAVGQRISFTNLEKVAGAISDLDRVFAGGHRAGEIGAGVASKARFEAAKAIGGETQDLFPHATSFPGKKAEVLFNMIPMLTQQGEKPGSVRIMRSVLRLLGQTLPDIGTGLKSGRRQMGESIRSFFRFARAAELTGLEFDKSFEGQDLDAIGDNELNAWIGKVKRAAERVQLGEEEAEALDDFIDNALLSSGNLVAERAGAPKQPSPEEISAARQRGAVAFDDERGVFVDAQGNEI